MWRHREISTRSLSGKVFIGGTIVSCLTGFGIFQHGGFGNPHILAIVTLVVLGVALAAEYARLFGVASRYVETVSYSLAFFFHFIPGTVETLVRVPAGAPYLSNPDDPKAQPIIGVFFLLFLVGATLQVLRLRARGGRRLESCSPTGRKLDRRTPRCKADSGIGGVSADAQDP